MTTDPAILAGAATGAVGKLVGLAHREMRAATEAEEGALARGRTGLVAIIERAAADAVEDRGASFLRPASILARGGRPVTQF